MRNLNQFLTMTAMTFAAGFILFAATEGAFAASSTGPRVTSSGAQSPFGINGNGNGNGTGADKNSGMPSGGSSSQNVPPARRWAHRPWENHTP